MDIGIARLHAQQIAPPRSASPESVVAAMAGLQGQDYSGAKWSIALRLADVTEDGEPKTRRELYEALDRAGISTAGQRGYHILWNSAQHQVLCFAGARGKEPTFVALDRWIAPERTAASRTTQAFLLPGFDEYILGYQKRGDVLEAIHAERICPGSNGVFVATLVVGGRVVGTWKRTLYKNRVEIRLVPFGRLSVAARAGVKQATKRHGAYLGLPVEVLDVS